MAGDPILPQAPLPLAYAPRLGPGDFCVSDNNRSAVQWLDDPLRWPMPRAVLVGPAGSGKSHLAALFARHHNGRVIDAADTLVDGEAMFHAWNAADASAPLLLTARELPRSWAHRLPDLASRLAATPLIRIEEPDDGLIAAVLDKRFTDRGLRVGPDVVAYLVARIERSYASLAEIVDRLDALSLAERREITVPLARELLDGQLRLAI
jgi:chromosomal replication initiation ATPase DnaA